MQETNTLASDTASVSGGTWDAIIASTASWLGHKVKAVSSLIAVAISLARSGIRRCLRYILSHASLRIGAGIGRATDLIAIAPCSVVALSIVRNV